MLTQERVQELFDYRDGKLYWKVANSNRVKVGQEIGAADPRGYRRVSVDGGSYWYHRLVWLWIKGYFPEHLVDHRDRIQSHNWEDNLREVSRTCNARNTGNFGHNTSGIKGVSLHKKTGKWEAHIKVSGMKFYLGIHTTVLEAVCHRLAAEQALGWEGCDSCSPAFQYVKNNILINN